MIFSIKTNESIACNTWRMVLVSDEYAGTAVCGQFVDVLLPGYFLRRPFAVSDCGAGWLELIYCAVGNGTADLSKMAHGQELDVLVDLGHGFDTGRTADSAVVFSGGAGVAPIKFLAKELAAKGRKVTAIFGFNKAEDITGAIIDEIKGFGAEVYVATVDGSAGTKGFVTDVVREYRPSFDFWYACGPLPMMKAIVRAIDVPGQVSMEARMGCGTGICYGCSIETAKGPRRVCKDGPVFDKEDMIW